MSTHPPLAQPGGAFARGLAIQVRVIGAMMLRELHTRYGRENVGYLWLFGEPMLLATVIGAIHEANGHTAYGADVQPLVFGVVCYTTFILFRGIVNRSEGGIDANAPLLYHRQVTTFDIVVARGLLEFAGVFLTYCILMALIVGAGLGEPPARPLALLMAWFLMFWYAFGHSLLITAVTYENHTLGRLIHPYSYFMIALSGAFTPLAWMPHTFRTVLSYVPLASIMELARYGQFRSFTLKYFFPQYLIGACLILTWVGLVQLRAVRNRIHLH